MNSIEGLTIRWEPWTVAAALAHLWQSSMVGILILVLIAASRRASARTRWMIGWIGLAKFALPLIWFNPTISRVGRVPMGSWSTVPESIAHSVADLGAGMKTQGPHAVHWAAWGAAVWAAGAVLLLGTWWLRSHRFRRRILASSGTISTDLGARVARISERVGLAQPPRCLSSGQGFGPGVVGVLSPFVVLPADLEASLSGEEMDAILLHELIHLKSRDTVWAGLQAVVVRIFWFDPVVWLLNRSLCTEMEKSCDEAVLDITADANVYADGILKIVRHSLGLQQPGFAGAAGVSIVGRMKNILSRAAEPRRRRPMTLAIGAASVLVVFSGYSGVIRSDAPVFVQGGKALVVRSLPTLGQIPSFESELGDLGLASATIGSADMATTDLSAYSLIVIPGTQLQDGFYADYAKAAARFDRFVHNGGTLLLEVKGPEGEGILRQRFGAIPSQADGSSPHQR